MQQADPFFNLFQQEVSRHGLIIDSVSADGLVYIKYGEADFKVSLDNARKSYELDGDTTKLNDLVRLVLNYTESEKLPSWKEARSSLLPILVPADMEFHGAVHRRLTDSICMVLVRNLAKQITWVQEDHVIEWKQKESILFQEAYKNLDATLDSSEIKLAILEGHPYGIVIGSESHLESSLLLAPRFKDKVQKRFGWPVYAVIPVRDLCFIFSQKQFNFFSKRLSSTVLEEFATSPYPVTRQLLKISDNGIEAVGHYAPRNDLIKRRATVYPSALLF